MLNIKNFCIIAHIDHGKSTLADRLLEYTETVSDREMKNQVLDAMELERERGITIKAKVVRMEFFKKNRKFILNLIDTPGHVDFVYEVSRSLIACEGALLIVDATQGVEAQTFANANLAKKNGIKIIPIINKIDIEHANINKTINQIKELNINMKPILISAKKGIGIDNVIESIINDIPSAKVKKDAPLSALVFDFFYDLYRGTIIVIRVFEGKITTGMKIKFPKSNIICTVIEVGYISIKMHKAIELISGEVGYIIIGVKNMYGLNIGDVIIDNSNTISVKHINIKANNKKSKPFIFAGFFPNNSSNYNNLRTALNRLKLSDTSFMFNSENSVVFGPGFRCGFLGSLHLEIIKERLSREFNIDLLVTAPNVGYKIKNKSEIITIDNPINFPNIIKNVEIFEPYVLANIKCPKNYIGAILELCKERRGKQIALNYNNANDITLKYNFPLSEIITDFYSTLKSCSKGYAIFKYEHIGFYPGNLTKLEILINFKVIDAFTIVVNDKKGITIAHFLTKKLKSLIPRHMFEIPIQARINNRIVSRETISALRKDVIAKCYGGDITRKRKLLEKQKYGKLKMKQFGRVEIPIEAFETILEVK
ncbi:MAG: translation elongation factor 4 [Endomicrobium sp.]|jgi:GTP-binding protein LepA|nr:translation elongation factor 4 [Endomicrobium sp.]